MPPDNPNRFRILALDGGGVRGICPATFLAQMEDDVGQPLYRYFDLVCGTSTGGILALALALGIPMSRVRDLYLNKADELFSPRRRWPKPRGYRSSKYHSEPLHAELRRVFGPDTLLGDANTRVCIPAANVTTGKNTVFKTRHLPKLEHDFKLPAWQCAAATAAAPIYFDPVVIPGRGELVDGGVWANTPALVGIGEARELSVPMDHIELLSIGTGSTPFHRKKRHTGLKKPFNSVRNGLFGWGAQLIDLFMQAQTDRAENLMRLLVPGQYQRIQFDLPDKTFQLDSVDKVHTLHEIATEHAKWHVRGVRTRFLDCPTDPFTPVPL